jgi:hypothetical protein
MSKKKKKTIDIYDVDHPFRRTAIDLIKSVIEPLMQRGINGQQYYNLENSLTIAIDKRLRNLIKSPIKADLNPTHSSKVLSNDHLDESDNDEDDDDYDEDDDEDDSW